jgi:hypothetical protein
MSAEKMTAAQSVLCALETLNNLNIDIEDNVLSLYLKDGVHVKDMIKIIQNHGLYNPTKLTITLDFSHIGTIVDLIETYTSMTAKSKLLIVGWAEEPRIDMDLGRSKFSLINNNLFMSRDVQLPITIEAIGLAYYGPTLTRLKVYELKPKRTSTKIQTVIFILFV